MSIGTRRGEPLQADRKTNGNGDGNGHVPEATDTEGAAETPAFKPPMTNSAAGPRWGSAGMPV